MGSCEKCNSGPGLCVECQAALQGRVKYLEAVQLAHREDAERHREENARLRKVVDAAREYFNAMETTPKQEQEKLYALADLLDALDGEKAPCCGGLIVPCQLHT